LQSLDAVAASGRRVIYYDQLGCGESAIESNPEMWTVELYVEEVGAVRAALGLETVHLLGQSWGGMLALEYALTQPTGLASLVLASTLSSASHWAEETSRLRDELPADERARLDELEADGLTDDPAYREASMAFNKRHVCRSEQWPEPLVRSFDRMSQEVYGTMWGPSEFNPTGTLRDWSVTERLGEIRVPTLITSGRYDESTPAINAVLQQGIAGSEQIIYEHSAHCSHLEEPEAYVRDLVAFLDRVDAAR
jgi:proline-specific peptidase